MPIARQRVLLVVFVAVVAAACGGSRSTRGVFQPPPPPTTMSLQALFEAARYQAVLDRVAAAPAGAEALWLAGHSSLRLSQLDAAGRFFDQLGAAGPSWDVASQLALAGLRGDQAAADRARDAAGAFPDDAYVQYELGLAYLRRSAFAEAAEAFDRAVAANPRFAYAYYYAGLAYDRLDRSDLMGMRMETFLRLAPQAPERPEVESIMRTLGVR